MPHNPRKEDKNCPFPDRGKANQKAYFPKKQINQAQEKTITTLDIGKKPEKLQTHPSL